LTSTKRYEQRKETLKQKLRDAEIKGEDVTKLKIEDSELSKQEALFAHKEEELKKKERVCD
jgi:hypothetical protein